MIYEDVDSILVPEDNGSKFYMNLIPANIKNKLFDTVVIYQCELMINLVILLYHTQLKMLFTMFKDVIISLKMSYLVEYAVYIA